MSAIGPGSVVEFIGPDTYNGEHSGLTIGASYIVAATEIGAPTCPLCKSRVDLYLERSTHLPWKSWSVCLFRPRPDRPWMAELLSVGVPPSERAGA